MSSIIIEIIIDDDNNDIIWYGMFLVVLMNQWYDAVAEREFEVKGSKVKESDKWKEVRIIEISKIYCLYVYY